MKTLIAMALGLTLAVFVVPLVHGDEIWTDYKRIDKMDVQDDFASVWVEGNDGCKGLYRLTADSDNYRGKLTLLMGAFFAGFEVNIKYYEQAVSSTECNKEYYVTKVRSRK